MYGLNIAILERPFIIEPPLQIWRTALIKLQSVPVLWGHLVFSIKKGKGRGWVCEVMVTSRVPHLLVGIVTQEPNIWTSLLLDPNMRWGVCNCSIFNTLLYHRWKPTQCISTLSRVFQGFKEPSKIFHGLGDFNMTNKQTNKQSYFMDRYESSTLDKSYEIKSMVS
jgi:hypothetical protein